MCCKVNRLWLSILISTSFVNFGYFLQLPIKSTQDYILKNNSEDVELAEIVYIDGLKDTKSNNLWNLEFTAFGR